MRPSIDEYFLDMAKVVSSRSTCLRRSVGCVLVDGYGNVLSTGYNGVARGLPHCNESVNSNDPLLMNTGFAGESAGELDSLTQIKYPHACEGATAKSGQALDKCEAIHAEQNALLQCKDTNMIMTAYVTVSPCIHCVKMLMNTPCSKIVFSEEYVHTEAKELWLKMGGLWLHVRS